MDRTIRKVLRGVCALALALQAHSSWGVEWSGVVPASCCCDAIDAGDCGDACCGDACVDSCGCATCGASCDGGYCFSFPLCDELTARLAPLMKNMADSGFVYAPQLSQFYQGVASGGDEQQFEYGGKVDQFVMLDSTKLGLWRGATMTLHAETRFGDDVNQAAVGFAPVNVAMLYPKPGEHETAITGLSFTQALSEQVQLTYGKFNVVDFFYQLYPQTGRGVSGFMNASMVLPMAATRVAPQSFLGAGAIKLHGKQVQGAVLVYDTNNSATTSGFDDLFNNGANILGYWRLFTEVGGLPGSHAFAGAWSTGDFIAFDRSSFVFIPGEGIVAEPQSGAYSVMYFLEQTLWMDCCHQERNISLLSQWSLADQATSPIGWSANVGIQGNGFSDSRPHDSFGVGYFHTGVSSDLQDLLSPLLTLQDVNGVELYYSAAVTKGLNLTADLQVIEPADVRYDTAVVVGLRLATAL